MSPTCRPVVVHTRTRSSLTLQTRITSTYTFPVLLAFGPKKNSRAALVSHHLKIQIRLCLELKLSKCLSQRRRMHRIGVDFLDANAARFAEADEQRDGQRAAAQAKLVAAAHLLRRQPHARIPPPHGSLRRSIECWTRSAR